MNGMDAGAAGEAGRSLGPGRFLACLFALQALSWGYLLAAILQRPWYDIVFGIGMVLLFLPTPGNLRYLRSPVFGAGPRNETGIDVALRWMALGTAGAGFLVRWWMW